MKRVILATATIMCMSSAFALETGTLIKLHKNNGGTCDAIMITQGKERSEIQFDGGCSNFPWYKADGERMWVDNYYIGLR